MCSSGCVEASLTLQGCLSHAGSCAITYEQGIGGPVTSEHDYFLKALELRSQCNVLVRPSTSLYHPMASWTASDQICTRYVVPFLRLSTAILAL